LSKEDQQRFAPICPDFIIELRSPTDSLPELVESASCVEGEGPVAGFVLDLARIWDYTG